MQLFEKCVLSLGASNNEVYKWVVFELTAGQVDQNNVNKCRRHHRTWL